MVYLRDPEQSPNGMKYLCCLLFPNVVGGSQAESRSEACSPSSHLLSFAVPSTDPLTVSPSFSLPCHRLSMSAPHSHSLANPVCLLSPGQTSALIQSCGCCPPAQPTPLGLLALLLSLPSALQPLFPLLSAGIAAGSPGRPEAPSPKQMCTVLLPRSHPPGLCQPRLDWLEALLPLGPCPGCYPTQTLRSPGPTSSLLFTEIPSELSSHSPASPHGSPLLLPQVQTLECSGLLPPAPQCLLLVHQLRPQGSDRTQPLVALHPLLPPLSLVSCFLL